MKDSEVGTQVRAVGRMQSRTYTKVNTEGVEVNRTAYEVSLSEIEEVKDIGER